MAESWRGQYSHNLHATTDPTVTDDLTQGYSQGSVWINSTAGRAWICTSDSPVGNASWSLVSTMGTTGSQATINQQGGTIPAAAIAGGCDNVVTSIHPSPGLLTTRTAAQLFTDIPGAVVGQSFQVRIINKGLTNLWLHGGLGVLLVGGGPIKPNQYVDFMVLFNSSSTLTMTSTGVGFIANPAVELDQQWKSLVGGPNQLQAL